MLAILINQEKTTLTVFADADGEAEMDANILKFTEIIAKGLEEMEITPEMMEQMVDSYNQKKENGEIETETPDVKAEHLHLVDELMLEMIYGVLVLILDMQCLVLLTIPETVGLLVG